MMLFGSCEIRMRVRVWVKVRVRIRVSACVAPVHLRALQAMRSPALGKG